MGLNETLADFTRLKDKRDELKAALETAELALVEAEAEVIKTMVETETEKITKGGATYFLSTRTFASPRGGMRDELYTWLKVHGYGDLVRPSVNANTLSAQVKEWMESDDGMPEGVADLLNIHDQIRVNVRKGRN